MFCRICIVRSDSHWKKIDENVSCKEFRPCDRNVPVISHLRGRMGKSLSLIQGEEDVGDSQWVSGLPAPAQETSRLAGRTCPTSEPEPRPKLDQTGLHLWKGPQPIREK